MKKILSKLLGGVLLFSLSMSLTSCEGALDDILGEWSRPAGIKEGTFSYATTSQVIGITVDDFVNPITIEGDGKVTYSSSDPTIAEVDPETGVITPHKTGAVTITATITDGKKYAYETKEISYTLKVNLPIMKWDDTNKKLVEADAEDGAMVMPAESELADAPANSKLLPAGTYIIAEDMTFNKNIQLSGDVDIILCDGKTLTFNMFLYGNDGSNSYKLNIYGQSEDTGKLIVSYGILDAKPLNVYGGQIDLTVSGNAALRNIDGMNVYGGKVNAVNNDTGSGGSGIKMEYGATLTIYGGEVFAKGPATDGHNGSASYGISAYDGNVVVNGGKLVAVGKKYSSNNSNGISGNLTVNGGSVEVKDVNETTGEISEYSRPAVSGTITVGAGVSLQGKNHDTDWADITDNTNAYKHIRTKQ